MLKQVEMKLQELNKKKAEQYYKKKETDLETWGLTARKGEPPVVVTDEEYEALVKASNGLTSRNGVAILLNIVAVTVLIFSIIGAFLLNVLSEESGFFYSIVLVICGIVFTTILGGLAEAIKLLQQLIDDKPSEIPGEYKVKQSTVVQQNAAPQQPPTLYQQQSVYQQPPVYQPPQYQQQNAYQQPTYQQAPPVYQQPQYQPSQYQPPYTPPSFDEDDIFKANAPVQFGE